MCTLREGKCTLHIHTKGPLRSAATGHLAHPASRPTVSCSSQLRSFSTLAPQWWNDPPISIRTAPSLLNFPPQLEDSLSSSLCTSTPLWEFPNLLSLFLYLSLAPVSSYLALINYICLGMVVWLVLYGSLTWPIQLVYLIHIHDLSTKSMWNVPYLALFGCCMTLNCTTLYVALDKSVCQIKCNVMSKYTLYMHTKGG